MSKSDAGGSPRWFEELQKEESREGLEAALRDAMCIQILSRLQGTVRHDFFSPLQSATWTLDLLQRNLQSDLSAERRLALLPLIEAGRKELGQLGAAVTRFLGDSIPAAADPQLMDLRELVHELEKWVITEASFLDVTVHLELPPQPVVIRGYRDRIKQTLTILILNTLDALPQGGQLSLDIREAEHWAELTVIPNGPQLRTTLRPEVLALQWSAPRPLAGIGFYVARRTATSHGGDIIMEERSDTEVVLRLRLPTARE
jgi:signal transduction histidine kinase